MVQAHDTIDRRVNELGVSEPNIAQHGDNGDQLLVQLPGINDVARAKDIIQSTARLKLKLRRSRARRRRARRCCRRTAASCRPTWKSISGAAEPSSGAAGHACSTWCGRSPPSTAAICGSPASASTKTAGPAVMFSLKPDGAREVRPGDRLEHRPARSRSSSTTASSRTPRIDGRITAEGRISGSFTQEEAGDLALMLRSGALPASMTYLEERVIGPTLGADSIRSGVIAALAGLVLVVLFMLVYYKLSGINAIVAMVVNLIILLGMMAYMGAAMTLPGIAGFILTMGMGVDSNVLIFERIKEELAAKKGARAAISASFDRVFLTLARHARHLAHRRGVPLPVRHRPDPRVRDDAVRRADEQPVHVDFRVADVVRIRPVAPAGERANRQHLGHHADPQSDELRLRTLALARDRAVAPRHPRRRCDDLDPRPPARRRLRRRQHRHRQVRAGDAGRARPRGGRRPCRMASATMPSCRTTASRRSTW